MKKLFIYLCLMALPTISMSQYYKTLKQKHILISRTKLDVHDHYVSFGTNAIFIVPTDTVGNLSFTGIINNIRVVGKLAPYICFADTTVVEDPANGQMVMTCDSIYKVNKHGEWSYYTDRITYHEFFDNGRLVSRDSLENSMAEDGIGARILDSMAHIRTYITNYIKKGDDERIWNR
jgi:hypothetical protein